MLLAMLLPATTGETLTIIDLRDGIRLPWNRGRVRIEAFQPISHSGLGKPIVPDDI